MLILALQQIARALRSTLLLRDVSGFNWALKFLACALIQGRSNLYQLIRLGLKLIVFKEVVEVETLKYINSNLAPLFSSISAPIYKYNIYR